MVHKIFDRNLVKNKRNQIAENYSKYNFILQEILVNFSERFEETTNYYESILDLGCNIGSLAELENLKIKSNKIIQMDLSLNMAVEAKKVNSNVIVADEESIPFKQNSFDLIVSALNLHTVNDLPGTLLQIRNILKKGGMLLAAFFGENNLYEFRQSINKAEIILKLPVRVHTFPLIELKTMGSLLQRTGFALPVVDKMEITAHYTDIKHLITDLEGMGQLGILDTNFNQVIDEELLNKANQIYKEDFLVQDNFIKATFEILIITGLNLS